jgi:phospholipase/carboxylesterase
MAHEGGNVSRREFLVFGSAVSASCARVAATGRAARDGRLTSRPAGALSAPPLPPGEHALALDTRRDGVVYVPREISGKVPLVVLLHGATGSARKMMSRVSASSLADEHKLAVLAIDSRATTWDVIGGRFGPDADFIDAALAHVFARVAIDPTHVAVGGFSDGASCALSLGVANGDLFTHVMAFSPGLMVADTTSTGRPKIYISHGILDGILPIDSTSRRLVPALRRAGYDVEYREFPGAHEVPPHITREAFGWMNGHPSARERESR